MEKDASEEERSESSTSVDESDTDEEVRSTKNEETEVAKSLSDDTRERLCLKAEPSQSTDITLHPAVVVEWINWMRKSLYDRDEEDHKKRKKEEIKLCEEIIKKFPKKGILHVEAPKLNPEILAFMSGVAKSRYKHFMSSQNALGSAMVAIAKSISLILELEEGNISSTLLEMLGKSGKLIAGLHYQHSITRRAFILPGIEEKYRELLKKSDITEDLFGNELFKRLKHTKSLGKIVEDLTPHQQTKKPLKMAN